MQSVTPTKSDNKSFVLRLISRYLPVQTAIIAESRGPKQELATSTGGSARVFA